MGIKLDEKTKTFTVTYSKRHPITRVPVSRKRIGIKSKSRANQVYAELILKVDEKLKEEVVPSWERLLDEYLKSFSESDVSLKTVDTYRMCLRAHTLEAWKGRLIDTISAQEIRDLIKEKVGHRSPSQQKNLLKYIRGAFTYAFECGYNQTIPVPRMKFKIGNKMKDVLTREQVNILLSKAKEVRCEWYPIWAMALYTGMRNGELYALTWDKVDLPQRKIKVDCSWNNKDGFKDTKSGDDRIVEIAPNLLEVMMQLNRYSGESNFVLPRIDKWDKGEQARELRRFLEGIGLPRIRFHDLRATWATIMLTNGVESIKVMDMGGWKDLKTMQFYVRKAGVSISGITDSLNLHNPNLSGGEVLQFNN